MGSQAAVVFLLTVGAAVLGFGRELATAAVYGTSASADAVALTLIYIEGVSTVMTYGIASQVLVPLFVGLDARGAGRDREVVSGLLTIVLLAGGGLTLFAWWQPEIISTIIAPKFSPDQRVALQPLILGGVPTCAFLAAAGVVSGWLRARSHFYSPVVGRGLFSLLAGMAVVLFGGAWGTRAAAIGLLSGAILQFGVQFWRLFAFGWSWVRPRLFQLQLGALAASSWQVVSGLVLMNLVLFAAQRALASDLPTGAFAAANYAQRLLSLASLLSLAVATVAATDFARRFHEGDRAALGDRAVGHLRALSFLLAPATVVLMGSSRLLVELAFHRGVYSESAAVETAQLLRLFCLSLLPGGVSAVMQVLFTSGGRPSAFLWCASAMTAATLVLTVLLKATLGTMVFPVAFVGGATSMFVASLLAARAIVGTLPVLEFCTYLIRLAGELALAGAVALVVLWLAAGSAGASRWLAGSVGIGESVLASATFLGALVAVSRIAQDRGLATLFSVATSTLRSLGKDQQ